MGESGTRQAGAGRQWVRTVVFVVGMTCFWPCVQAHPYQVVISQYLALTGGWGRSFFSVGISVALAIVAVVLGFTKVGAGTCGALGTGIAGACGFLAVELAPLTGGGVLRLVVSALGCCAIAYGVVGLLLGWGRAAVSSADDGRLLGSLVSFGCYELIDLVATLADVSIGPAVVLFPLVSGVCLQALAGTSVPERRLRRDALRKIPWGLMGAGALFVLLDNLFVKVLNIQSNGASGASRVARIVIVLVAVICVAWYLRAVRITPTSILSVFIACFVLYIMGLLITLLHFNLSSAFENQVWVAAGVVLKMFLWLMCAYYARRERLSVRGIFAFYAIGLVALPFAVSLDMRTDGGLAAFLARVDNISIIGEVLFFVVAVAIIGAMALQLLGTTKNRLRDEESREADRVQRALAGFEMTDREIEVAGLACSGMSAKRIAEQLSLSEFTVNNHLAHIYRKLGVHSKQDLMAYVKDYGRHAS